MKKLINLKKIIILSIGVILISISSTAFATDVSILDDNNSALDNNVTNVEDLGSTPIDTSNSTGNNTNISAGTNNAAAYNTVDEDENEDDLPQTGIEDYNIGILLIICVGASIYTYKKMKDYKNI